MAARLCCLAIVLSLVATDALAQAATHSYSRSSRSSASSYNPNAPVLSGNGSSQPSPSNAASSPASPTSATPSGQSNETVEMRHEHMKDPRFKKALPTTGTQPAPALSGNASSQSGIANR